MAARPVFDPVDTSFDPHAHSARDDVESPSLTSGNALARFEFEPGRSKDGTKVLMVEWEEDETTNKVAGSWELSWDGKKTVLPAREVTKQGEEQPVNRLYFLLGPGMAVPTTVKLRKGAVTWRTNPLPAIFSPELGATAREAGKKGVLHTIWAKKRVQVLQQEIEQESKENAEGIGLEMAVAEKEWIEQNFGVPTRQQQPAISLNSPTSPRSPGGGRLMDKLKGLKLGTTTSDLSTGAANQSGCHNPLSPETSDVAYGSFGSFAELKGMPAPSSLGAKPPQPPTERKVVAARPPEALQRQQFGGGGGGGGGGGMGSLNAFASGETGFSHPPPPPEADADDDLFALPMSPRSPEMTKSPFSFAAQDTANYAKGERTGS